MPNWKTYDSSVRLLSAILAAHPELKLNYADIAKFFGDSMTDAGMQWRFRRIKTDAKKLQQAVGHGLDPCTVTLEDATGLKQCIAARLGPDISGGAVEIATRRLRKDSHALEVAFQKGADPRDVPMSGLGQGGSREIANHMETGVDAMACQNALRGPRKDAAAVHAAYLTGTNTLQVSMYGIGQGTAKGIAKHMEPGLSKDSVRMSMAYLKRDSVDLRAAVSNGQSALTVPVSSIGQGPRAIATHMEKGVSGGSVYNAMTNINKDVLAVRQAVLNDQCPSTVPVSGIGRGVRAVAAHFQTGCTEKAIRVQMGHLNRDVKTIREAVTSGQDPFVIDIAWGPGARELAKHVDSNIKPRTMELHISAHRVFARLLVKAVASGTAPEQVSMASLGKSQYIAGFYGPGCTYSAVEHYMRPIRAHAKSLKNGSTPAGGDDATPKSAAKPRGGGRRPTPRSGKGAGTPSPVKVDEDNEGNSDETPTVKKKKASGVKSGRVQKKPSARAVAALKYGESDDDAGFEDAIDDSPLPPLKFEHMPALSASSMMRDGEDTSQAAYGSAYSNDVFGGGSFNGGGSRGQFGDAYRNPAQFDDDGNDEDEA